MKDPSEHPPLPDVLLKEDHGLNIEGSVEGRNGGSICTTGLYFVLLHEP